MGYPPQGQGSATLDKIIVGVGALKISNDTARVTSSLTAVKLKEILINENLSGVILVQFTLTRGGGGSGYIHGRLYKNGIALGTLFDTTAVGTKTENVTVSLVNGDKLQIYTYMDASAVSVTITNFQIAYDYQITSILGYTLTTTIYATAPTISTTNQDP